MRVVSADSVFRVGKTHQICQDYAAHYAAGGVAVAHLADGCSTATSPHAAGRAAGNAERQVYTDFGSRLLVLAAQQSLWLTGALSPTEEGPSPVYCQDVRWAARRAHRAAQGLGLSADALSATLLSVSLRGQEVVGEISGDGWFAGRRREGTWEVIQVEYLKGAPYYLRYSLDEGDYSAYLAMFGGGYEVRMWHTWYPGQELGAPAVQARQLGEAGLSGPPFHADQFVWSLAEFDLVLAFSDGLGTFGRQVVTATSKEVEPVSVGRVLTRVAGCIKGTRGAFLARNLNGPVGAFRQFAAEGWEHHDDLAIAGVYCNGEE